MKKEKTPFWKVPGKSECRTLTDEEKQAVYQEILERAAANDDLEGSVFDQAGTVKSESPGSNKFTTS